MMGRLLCTLAFVIVSAVPGSALSARPANLTHLLERLAVERNVHIAFSHMLTDPVVVRDPSSEGDVPAVLERWLEGTDLQFKHLGENYYIYKGYRQDTLPGVSAAPVSMPAPAFDPLPAVAPVPLPQSVQRRFYESLRAASVPLPAPHSSFRPVRLEPVPIFRPAAALPTPGSGYLPAWAVKTNLLYDWVLGNRWGLEATVGAGYAYLDYDMYPCAKCGRKIGGETQHYFGPTKAGITLIFMVK